MAKLSNQSSLFQPHNHRTEIAFECLNLATEAEPVTGALFSEQTDCHSCIQKFMDAVPMPMAIKGADLKYKMCNQQFADIVNWPREKVIEKSAYDLFPEQLASYTELLDQSVLVSGELSVSEPNLTAESKSGSRHFVMHKTALIDADGNRCGIIGTGVDITPRKKMEEAIRNLSQGVSAHVGKEFFSRLVKLLAETLDADHVVISRHDSNQGGVGQNLGIYANGVFKEGFACELKNSACWKTIARGDSCLSRDDAKHFCPECIMSEITAEGFIGTALYDREGVAVGAISVISKKKKFSREFAADILNLFANRASCEIQRLGNEEELVSTRDFYLSMLSNIPAMTWRKDTEGGFDYFNDTWLAFTGLTQEKAQQMTQGQFVHPDDRQVFLRTCEAAYSDQKPFQIEMRLRYQDGTHRWVINSGRPFYTAAGNFAGYVGSCIDVNERKANEDHLRLVQRMGALGRLSGGIAHEFNNILAVIEGHAELLKMKHTDDAPLNKALDAILAASGRASHLTGSMLAYTQRQLSRPEDVDLSMIVSRMTTLLKNIIRKDKNLEIDLAKELLPVHVDGGQIEQVLMNLASNAQEALLPGGTLVIRTMGVQSLPDDYHAESNAASDRYAVLSLIDNGCGMSADILANMYEPYFTTKVISKGTGLGLSVAYGIVAQHRGHIICKSEVGQGTTFNVYLPLVESGAAAWPAGRDDELDDGIVPQLNAEKTILLIDDDQMVRDVVVETLESQGYSVLCAASADEGWDLYRQNTARIDLVLNDLNMPKQNGLEFAKELRSEQCDLPVMLMTGNLISSHLAEIEPALAIHMLQKPFLPSELLGKVKELIDEKHV